MTIFSLCLITAERAQAHGGALQVPGDRAGPYVVSVWTQPDPPRVGRLDVSVAVMQPATRKPVLDAETRVTGEHLGTSERTSARAGLDAGWLYSMYYADLELPTPGRWRITVSVAGPDGNGSAGFDLEVRPPSPIPWRLIWTVVALLLLTLIAWPWFRPITHRQSR